MIARFLGVRVWELNEVPEHYLAEAVVIINARKGARSIRAQRAASKGAWFIHSVPYDMIGDE